MFNDVLEEEGSDTIEGDGGEPVVRIKEDLVVEINKIRGYCESSVLGLGSIRDPDLFLAKSLPSWPNHSGSTPFSNILVCVTRSLA